MQTIITHWHTSLAGIVVIALGALNTFAGVHVPGFDLGFTAALSAGAGLIVAADGSKS